MDILNKAKAQEIDEIASSTIPFELPVSATPTPGGSIVPTLSGPNISLSTNLLEMAVGDKVQVEVKINTLGIEIGEYTFYISFNPQLFNVVDADTETANIQVQYTDTFFGETQNQVSLQNGTIIVSGESTEGVTTISNRTVAVIELESIAEGFSEVEIIKENSSLINSNSIDILESTNSLNFVISNTTIVPSPVPTSVTTSPVPSIIPPTALFDDPSHFKIIATGIILICVGFYIMKYRKDAKI